MSVVSAILVFLSLISGIAPFVENVLKIELFIDTC